MMDPPDDRRDVIEHGDQRDRPTRWSGWAGRRPVALAAAALAVGLIAGYLGGHQHNGTQAPTRPTPTASESSSRPSSGPSSGPSSAPAAQPNAAPDLTATGNRCAVQRGTSLQLGVEVANESGHPVAVGQFRAVLPIGGLRATAASVGTCGALPAVAPTSLSLPAGATEWLTITFHVLVRCPQPLPVQFEVVYTAAGKLATAQLDEFPDLSQVAYNGCPTAQ
jgi:hypothetical protein